MNSATSVSAGEAHATARPLQLQVSRSAEEALSRTGRTEDIRFSPDNRRLALAGFAADCCLVFDVSIDVSAALPVVRITDHIEIRSPQLREPHGFDFIGNDRLVVANRVGAIEIFQLPPGHCGGRTFDLQPVRSIRRANLLRRLRNPGSVCVAGNSDGRVELLACDNYKRRVTRHVLDLNNRLGRADNRILLRNRLDIPDGIALSDDRRWLAVSNHNTSSVLIFDRHGPLNPASAPAGELTGVMFPHGLRFSPDGRRLYVADAGAPRVCLFTSDDATWSGRRAAVRSVGVMDQETFLRGHCNRAEGGPKGLDIDASGSLLAVTCEHMPLAMFPVSGIFAA
ncbi:hypothetical protein DFR52_102409 [Hoeflea marina]|uniref:Uncharacterized protein n=1 Tax=Hoeflea marina TaxID=274592 RepID=A0A317PLB6_9HYPH|nr:hypothetical protein [Hoeflea marina]PWW01745.1 hypothetical protein DFR52_102409 [Hoeflea marina]